MAAPIIKVKRSAVAGKIPTIADLGLGELAINTYDGKVYIEQDQGGVGVGTTIITINPWSVGLGSNAYNTYFTAGSVGVGTTNPGSKLTVNGAVQIQQDSGSNNRLIFRGQPGSSYRWNVDNYGSANDFRIFREDDATAANGVSLISISTTGTLTATKFSGDGSLLTGIIASGSGVVIQNQGSNVGTANTINFSTNLTASFSSGTATISLSNNPSITGILTADQVYTSNNGNGQNVRIGDDLWIGDVNVSNTTRFSGAQDSTKAFIIFGSSDAVALGRTGTGPLYYGGDFTISGVATANSFRVRGGAPGAVGVNNNGYGFFSPGDNDSGMYSSADGQIEFYTNNTEAVRIDSNQRVGIGTTNPTSTLTVTGNALFNGTGIVTASSFSGNASSATYATNAGTSTSVIGGIGSITQLQVTGISTFTNGPVFIGAATSTGTASQPLQVTGGTYISGNLGIGTTNPTQTLHVQGNARVTGGLYDSNNNVGTAGSVLSSTGSGLSWIPAPSGGGGAGTTFFGAKFDTNIDSTLYIQPTGTLDIVGVGTTTTQITTFPAGSSRYIIHSIHVTNISNGDAEISGGFLLNSRSVPASISVSVGQSGSAGVNTVTVGSGSTILVGMSVIGTGNIGETTGIGSTAGFQFNTYVTSVDGNIVSLSKPMSGRAVGVATFTPTSKFASRLPVPAGSAVELLKQPMVLNALDSIVLQSTGAGSGIGSTSTAAISQTANSNILTVTAGAAITNFITAGQLIQGTGSNTGIQTNTYVGVGYIPGALSVPMTRPATSTLASQILSFTEVIAPEDGALQATIVYQTTTDTSFQNGTGTVSAASPTTTSVTAGLSTVPVVYYGTGNTYPSVIQSIRVTNISDGSIYPGGDYSVSVGIGNSDTIFSWLAYNMVIPKNSSIELCEAPKRLGIGQSIFAVANTPYTIEIQIAGRQKTS